MTVSNVSVSQKKETGIEPIDTGTFRGRYAYARSFEGQRQEVAGQDYLTFKQSGDFFLFALCDGVSQAFYGDLTARVLGDALLNWLDKEIAVTANADVNVIRANLHDFLRTLAKAEQAKMEAIQPPSGLPPMRLDSWEKKRAKGGESMFVCGRIDLPSHTWPYGRVLLAWLGDCRLRIWGMDGEESTSSLGGEFNKNHKWTTREGPLRSMPFVFVGQVTGDSAQSLARIVAYSDGLKALDSIVKPVKDKAIQKLIDDAYSSPDSDDISLIELWLNKVPELLDVESSLVPVMPAVEPVESHESALIEPALHSPTIKSIAERAQKLCLEVLPSDEEKYEILIESQISGAAKSVIKTLDTVHLTVDTQGLPHGRYRVKARKVQAGKLGPWSDSQPVKLKASAAKSGLAAWASTTLKKYRLQPSPRLTMKILVLLGVVLVAGLLVGIVFVSMSNLFGISLFEATSTVTSPPPSPVETADVTRTVQQETSTIVVSTASPTSTPSPTDTVIVTNSSTVTVTVPLPTDTGLPPSPTSIPLVITRLEIECIQGCTSSEPSYSMRVVVMANGGIPPYTYELRLSDGLLGIQDTQQPGDFVVQGVPRCTHPQILVITYSADNAQASYAQKYSDIFCEPSPTQSPTP